LSLYYTRFEKFGNVKRTVLVLVSYESAVCDMVNTKLSDMS